MRLPARFLPQHLCAIKTPLTPEECVNALAAVTDQSGALLQWRTTRYTFRGWVADDGFRLMRAVRYRNSFRPVIHGALEPGPGGTLVRMKMQLDEMVPVFLGVWAGGIVVGVIAVVLGLVSGQAEPHAMMLIPFFLLALGAFMLYVPFRAELAPTEEALVGVLGGVVVDDV